MGAAHPHRKSNIFHLYGILRYKFMDGAHKHIRTMRAHTAKSMHSKEMENVIALRLSHNSTIRNRVAINLIDFQFVYFLSVVGLLYGLSLTGLR